MICLWPRLHLMSCVRIVIGGTWTYAIYANERGLKLYEAILPWGVVFPELRLVGVLLRLWLVFLPYYITRSWIVSYFSTRAIIEPILLILRLPNVLQMPHRRSRCELIIMIGMIKTSKSLAGSTTECIYLRDTLRCLAKSPAAIICIALWVLPVRWFFPLMLWNLLPFVGVERSVLVDHLWWCWRFQFENDILK
jgi:hypothetical protein